MLFLRALAASFLGSLACLGILLSPIGQQPMLDRPNERLLHGWPVPRSGRISIPAAVLIAIARWIDACWARRSCAHHDANSATA